MNSTSIRMFTFFILLCLMLGAFAGCNQAQSDNNDESTSAKTESLSENEANDSLENNLEESTEKNTEAIISETVSEEFCETTTEAEEITDVMSGDVIEAEYAAEFSVSRVFSNDMVVQRNEHIRVWGFAPESENGKKVSGEFKGTFAEALIESGEWCLTFGARLEADTTPAQMKIYTDKKKIVFNGVLVGDVYMVIGQSNVEYDVKTHIDNTDANTQGGGISAIDPDSIIRLNRSNHSSGGSYPSKLAAEPCADFRGTKQWTKTTESDTLSFSALGYYFAKALVEKNGNSVPVGVIEIGFAGAPLGSFLPNEIAEQYKTDMKDTSAGGYTTTGANGTGNGRFIYNHYIYPFEKYAIAGLVWYQGESNNSLEEARKYNEFFIALMNYMRGTHNLVNKDFPIFVTEIPSIYKAPANYSGQSWQYMNLGIIRAYMGAIPMELENCYVSSGADMWSDEAYHNSLHPNCKFEQADRLSDIAMSVVNGSGSIADATGPILKSYEISEDMKTATLKFDNVGAGLKTVDGNAPAGFAVYLDGYFDGRYISPDKVEIKGKDTVIITHSENFNGIAYNVESSDRFGKTVNLCNSANIPATAFSTDFTEKLLENVTTAEFVNLSDAGNIGKFVDYIKVDGNTVASGSDAITTSYIEITDDSSKLVIRGWCGFKREILLLGYAIDDYTAIFNAYPESAEQAVINAAGQYAARMTVTADISELSPGYHTFYLLAYVNIKGGIPAKLMTFQIYKPENVTDAPKFYATTDAGIVDYNVDSVKVDGTVSVEGPSTKKIQSLKVNTQNKKLTFAGWAGFKSDFVGLGYAFDNDNASMTATPTQTKESAVIARAGELAKRFSITVDISGLSAGDHTMYLLALVDENGGKLAKLMEFTLTVSEKCPHNVADKNGWSAVLGEARETAKCINCGENITRNTLFYVCNDSVVHGGGTKVGSMGIYDTPFAVSIPNAFVTSNGLSINGWVGMNSGVSAYKWSVNGVDWFDVDPSSTYVDAPTSVINTINSKNQTDNLGFTDFAHKTRFTLKISSLNHLEAGVYDFYIGAIPNNNPDTVVTIIKVNNVEIIDTSNSLKTINGIAISDYSVAIDGSSYGVQYASSLLLRELYARSGMTPKNKDKASGDKTILITSSDTCNNGTVSGGEYYIEVNGNTIVIGGSGIYGPIAAVDAFIKAIEGNTNATISSFTAPILNLSTVKAKLENMDPVNIGFIGDSVTYGHGPVTPWPSYFENLLKEEYSSATLNTSNVAKSGSTTKWGRENLKSLLLDNGYNDLIFLSHGTNDKYNSLDYQDTYKNYVSMITQIRKSNPNCDIVFVMCGRNFEQKGIMGISGGSISPYMMAMIDIAREYGIGIIDPMTTLYEAGDEQSPGNATGSGWRYYMQDEVHPNELGQQLYGKVVYSYIASALK